MNKYRHATKIVRIRDRFQVFVTSELNLLLNLCPCSSSLVHTCSLLSKNERISQPTTVVVTELLECWPLFWLWYGLFLGLIPTIQNTRMCLSLPHVVCERQGEEELCLLKPV